MKSNAVVYRPAEVPRVRSRGRPRIYGDKLHLRDLWKQTHRFQAAKSPVYGERQIDIDYFPQWRWLPGMRCRWVVPEVCERRVLVVRPS